MLLLKLHQSSREPLRAGLLGLGYLTILASAAQALSCSPTHQCYILPQRGRYRSACRSRNHGAQLFTLRRRRRLSVSGDPAATAIDDQSSCTGKRRIRGVWRSKRPPLATHTRESIFASSLAPIPDESINALPAENRGQPQVGRLGLPGAVSQHSLPIRCNEQTVNDRPTTCIGAQDESVLYQGVKGTATSSQPGAHAASSSPLTLLTLLEQKTHGLPTLLSEAALGPDGVTRDSVSPGTASSSAPPATPTESPRAHASDVHPFYRKTLRKTYKISQASTSFRPLSRMNASGPARSRNRRKFRVCLSLDRLTAEQKREVEGATQRWQTNEGQEGVQQTTSDSGNDPQSSEMEIGKRQDRLPYVRRRERAD